MAPEEHGSANNRDRFIAGGLALIVLLLGGISGGALAQIPDEFRNLRVLPEDTDKDTLVATMRGFSFALGVRCQYCHAGGDGVSFEGVDFQSDDDPDKRKARFMMRMTENLNRQVLPLIPERDAPAAVVECKTCHRGLAKPVLLSQELERIVITDGAETAVARYRELRENYGLSGVYDFGEWETNTVAERLTDQGRNLDAIRIYELNGEFHPESMAIALRLGELYEATGDVKQAIEHYERVLELRPANRTATSRLEALRAE